MNSISRFNAVYKLRFIVNELLELNVWKNIFKCFQYIFALCALKVCNLLTHISLASFLWDIGNKQWRPLQTPQNAASDQGLHCLLTECSIKI